MKRSFLLFLLVAGAVLSAPAQSGAPDIQSLVAQIDAGNGDAVRGVLPALLSQHPNHPGVLYLQALLTREGADAIRTYLSIVDNFPKDEWADDALYKVYQFYYALGLYRTADLKMARLRAEYPASPYVIAASQAATSAPVATSQATTSTPVATSQATTSTPVATSQAATSAPVATSQATTSTPVAASVPATAAPEAAQAGLPPPDDRIRPVEVKTEPMVQDPPPPLPAAARADSVIRVRFSLQVGAFTLHANAAAEKSRFEALGYDAEMLSKVRDTRSLFIVMIGNYATYDEAKTAAAEVKRKSGVSAMVVSR